MALLDDMGAAATLTGIINMDNNIKIVKRDLFIFFL
jgi:hypothetical protein